ncbi:ATP synthase F1 subunit gamma [Flammeovirga yaeyamensis]|uniref:ATP synthase gamma chain n=1 Tax=Flammeovirga yaeyamensis TaxID=367791 RepID=A0AAX1N9D3_9BACT|nr:MULTISPECIES: ATP synthase F1 subunit gamma [Flammeovirga]ANQ49993.1 ATP synthase F1 subunit gamma [Flammeovirga sp. MY04]MBB3700494.1 F-type H+-transporting ATPase subunit gamma [Flammeovirga yaeyamensis]NMF36884.1 ATP synthase F1 subunit gamma [Flammeovirga yaeyamensis]QWG02568.1 ATP synthase F1 subunit gamma [Flammeovirga yaeyamensis]
MASLKEVKERISSVDSTQQITKAMKMVSAAKMRRAQDRVTGMRPYADKLASILENVTAALGTDFSSPFVEAREEVNSVLVIVVTSDRGLAGAFNSNIQKEATRLINEEYSKQHQAGRVEVLAVGSKGADFFRRRGHQVNNEFMNLFHNLDFDGARKAAEYAMDGYVSGKFDQVVMVYNEFKNVATQIVRAKQFLPFALENNTEEQEDNGQEADYIFEPEKDKILSELIPKTLKVNFYSHLLDSNAAEHGARMTAMDKATENAGDLLKALKLDYNRSRQAAITNEILEIVGGAEALAGS